jgi:hypothetical protein
VDEWRVQQGVAPLPNGAGSVERLAEERMKGGDETGALAKVEAKERGSKEEDDASPSTKRSNRSS